jgi:hypothetical protein
LTSCGWYDIYIFSFSNRKATPGEFTPVEVAVLKGRTSKSSLGGEIMSTEILTTITIYILVGGLSAALTEALYCRQLAKASVLAAAVSAAIHLVFVMSAWKEAAEEVPHPGVSSLPTAVYDATAWAAVVFLTTGIVLAAIQQHRREVAKKKLVKYLTHSLGVNEPEENESEKD